MFLGLQPIKFFKINRSFFSRIPAHRIILSAASPYFSQQLAKSIRLHQSATNNVVVTINNVNGKQLQDLIAYCYTGCINITDANIDGILQLSALQCVTLQMHCHKYLLQTLNRSNCLNSWILANQYNFQTLKIRSNEILTNNFSHLINSHAFLNLHANIIKLILAKDDLYVYSEEVSFNALIRWIRYDEFKRRPLFAHLMPLVRIGQLKMSVRKSPFSLNLKFDFFLNN